MDKVDKLKTNLEDLQSKINENDFRVQNAETVAKEAEDLANKATKVCDFFIASYGKQDVLGVCRSTFKNKSFLKRKDQKTLLRVFL